MPNVFREQAEDRFHRSLAFLNKAETLLQDDLVNRSALADAVSAIKNMLQGYLLLRVSRTQEAAVTQRWQEIAASNSMPDLLQACGEAGLDLRGLAVEIKGLNHDRNRRMHDDPSQRIETQQARQALDLARKVQGRIKAAVQGTTANQPEAVVSSAPARLAAVARAAVTGQLGRAGGSHPVPAPLTTQHAETVATDPSGIHAASQRDSAPVEASIPVVLHTDDAAATASVVAPAASHEQTSAYAQRDAALEREPAKSIEQSETLIPDETEGENDFGDPNGSGDTRLLAVLTSPEPERRQSRVRRVLARALLIAAVLILGIVAGAGLMLPIATGHAPGWLAFATKYLPATPTANVAPMATVTPAPAGPFAAGSLIVTPSCAGSGSAVTLINTGVQPVRWSIGSPDGTGVLFAFPSANASVAAPSQSGTLKGGASVTLSVSGSTGGASTVVVVASTGTVQLPAPTC